MPSDPSAANSDDRSKLRMTWSPARELMAYTATPCVHTRGLARTIRPPAVRHRAKVGGPGLDSEHRTAHFSAPRHRRKS
jgi:hypothetical protein